MFFQPRRDALGGRYADQKLQWTAIVGEAE